MWVYSRIEPRQELVPSDPSLSFLPSDAPKADSPLSDESDLTHTPAHRAPHHHHPSFPAQQFSLARRSPSPFPTPQQARLHLFNPVPRSFHNTHEASSLPCGMPRPPVLLLNGLARPAVRRPSSATQFRTPTVKPDALTVPAPGPA